MTTHSGWKRRASTMDIDNGPLRTKFLIFSLLNVLLLIVHCTSYEVRLRSGGTQTITDLSGRVEVRKNGGRWGTVCDDYFDKNDATVICKYLGYKKGTARQEAYYGQGTGSIFMDDLKCRGSESSPFSCSYGGWGSHNCRHSEDAGVYCQGRDYQVRLRGGINTEWMISGRVEVRKFGGSWGTVCDDDFGTNDAKVICKYLNHDKGIPKTTAFFGQGTGAIHWDNLSCNGRERSPFHCSNNGWGRHNCGHYEDAGVVCKKLATRCSGRTDYAKGGTATASSRAFGSTASRAFQETYERTSDFHDDHNAGWKPRKLGLKWEYPLAFRQWYATMAYL